MLRVLLAGMEARPQPTPERVEVTCDACFFRQADLCAIPGNAPCPTFRPVSATLAPPPPAPPKRKRGAPVPAAA